LGAHSRPLSLSAQQPAQVICAEIGLSQNPSQRSRQQVFAPVYRDDGHSLSRSVNHYNVAPPLALDLEASAL